MKHEGRMKGQRKEEKRKEKEREGKEGGEGAGEEGRVYISIPIDICRYRYISVPSDEKESKSPKVSFCIFLIDEIRPVFS